MKKKLLIMMLALIMTIASAFALTACGETNGNGNGDNSGSTVVTPDTDTGNGGDGSGNQGDGNSNETHTHAFTLELTGDKYLVSPATCTAKAKYYYSCNCGEKSTDTFESGSMLPHTYDKQVATDKYLASPATATSAARYYYSCVCGAKGTATFEYGEAIIPETEGLQYTLLDDDTYEVTFDGNAVTGDALTKIVIPSKYNGKAVTKIAYLAFYDYDSLVEIEIPETITKIGDYAFLYSGGLKQITVDPNNKNYQSINGNLYSKDGRTLIQYAAGKTDTSFTIPENVTQIDKFAFNECRNLTSVTLPQNLESVGVGAFDLIGILTGNTGIGDTNEYNGAYYLGSVDNPYMLLLKVKDKEITEFTIPEETKFIGDAAFSDCSLTAIKIPDSVISIGYGAFRNCYSLNEITIGKGVKSIGYGAFRNESNLKSRKVFINDLKAWCEINFIYSDIIGSSDMTSNPLYCNSDLYLNGELVKELEIPDGVTKISDYAFYSCGNLTSISIPDSVTEIGSNAFEHIDTSKLVLKEECGARYLGCNKNPYLILMEAVNTDITECTINADTKAIAADAFYECDRLTQIIIPDGVTSIGDWAFGNCGSLTSITIPDSVTSIGSGAFTGCYSLKNVDIPQKLKTIRQFTFLNCVSLTDIKIPDSVVCIEANAFYDCYGLTSITIPGSVEVIGDGFGRGMFYGCDRLVEVYDLSSSAKVSWRKVKLPNPVSDVYTDKNTPSKLTRENDFVIHTDGNVKTIVGYFGDKTEIEIPNSVTSVGYKAFNGCTSLTSITIPNSVTSIGYEAFNYCYRLAEIYNLSSINITKGSSDNGYVGYYALNIYTDKDTPSKLTRENDFVIHTDGNAKIVVGYFGDKTEITVPKGVTSIGTGAFSGCSSLTNIDIPNSVTSLGADAFAGCSRLVSVTIGNSVTSIGDYAFNGCRSLMNIKIPSSVTSIGECVFFGCSSLTSITIPNSVTSIGRDAFENCSSLKTINCEAESQPVGWDNRWNNACSAEVIWGYKGGKN